MVGHDVVSAVRAGVFVALLWAGYRLRLRQLHYQYDMTLEARGWGADTNRRELHDTLAAKLPRSAARDSRRRRTLLPDRPADAKQKLDGAILNTPAKAITEGRDACKACDRRPSKATILAMAIRTLGDERMTGATAHPPPCIRVRSRGDTRDLLRPIVRDEIYKIAAEACRNCFGTRRSGQVRGRDPLRQRGVPIAGEGRRRKGQNKRFSRAQGVEPDTHGRAAGGAAPSPRTAPHCSGSEDSRALGRSEVGREEDAR